MATSGLPSAELRSHISGDTFGHIYGSQMGANFTQGYTRGRIFTNRAHVSMCLFVPYSFPGSKTPHKKNLLFLSPVWCSPSSLVLWFCFFLVSARAHSVLFGSRIKLNSQTSYLSGTTTNPLVKSRWRRGRSRSFLEEGDLEEWGKVVEGCGGSWRE